MNIAHRLYICDRFNLSEYSLANLSVVSGDSLVDVSSIQMKIHTTARSSYYAIVGRTPSYDCHYLFVGIPTEGLANQIIKIIKETEILFI